jgi:hypothetical protein
MRKLTYWVAICKNDSEHYSLRTKTLREMKKLFVSNGGIYSDGDFEKPKKVTVEFEDTFDLMSQCTCEGWGYWEHGSTT